MIWYYLAGWISGAIAVVMVLRWWFHTHMQRVDITQEELDIIRQKVEEENKNND